MLVPVVAVPDLGLGAPWPQPPRTTIEINAHPSTHPDRDLGMDPGLKRTLQSLRHLRAFGMGAQPIRKTSPSLNRAWQPATRAVAARAEASGRRSPSLAPRRVPATRDRPKAAPPGGPAAAPRPDVPTSRACARRRSC